MTMQSIYLYKILSLGFSYPDERNWRILEELLRVSEDLFEGPLSSAVGDVRSSVATLHDSACDRESEYLRIFDMGGLVSPYETEYLREKISRKPFELADIAGFDQAFGFEIGSGTGNREAADHVAVELEFMAILTYKELHAEENGEAEHLSVVRDAQMKFLNDHLARWGFAFCERVLTVGNNRFYTSLAAVLERALVGECEKHGLAREHYAQAADRPSTPDLSDDEQTCGQQLSLM